MCCNIALMETGKKGRCRGPDDINHRPHVSPSSLRVGLPIRYRFVHVKNRLIVAEADLIKQGNVSSKLFPNEDLVVSPHCNHKIGRVDQLLGELPLDMTGRISSLLA